MKRRKKIKNKIKSVQEWIQIEKISENGIIKMKNNNYIKIIKVVPVNYYLKSELEKEAILNAYKNFLKSCNFNMQILIQSQKEDLSTHCSSVKKQSKKETNKILELSNNYLNYIQDINNTQKSATKSYYIIINDFDKKNIVKEESIFFEELKDKYYIIKENLSRCGNNVINISSKKEIKNILYSFFNKNTSDLEVK